MWARSYGLLQWAVRLQQRRRVSESAQQLCASFTEWAATAQSSACRRSRVSNSLALGLALKISRISTSKVASISGPTTDVWLLVIERQSNRSLELVAICQTRVDRLRRLKSTTSIESTENCADRSLLFIITPNGSAHKIYKSIYKKTHTIHNIKRNYKLGLQFV